MSHKGDISVEGYFEGLERQELCLKPDHNVSEMDFFKTMVDGWLIDMEEAYSEAEVSKDVATGDPAPEVQEEEKQDA